MRYGILLIVGALFVCSVLPAALAEETAPQAKAAETKPAEKSAPAKTEQPKTEEKKVDAQPEKKKPETKPAEKKADTKPQEKKTEPQAVKPEAKKPESKPVEKKPEEKKAKPEDAKSDDKKAEKKPDPAKKEKWKEQLQKEHEVFLEWFEKNYPGKYKNLIKNRDSQPDKFVQHIGNSMKVYGPIQREEKRHPELAKALKEDLRLVEQRDKLVCDIRKAKPEQQKAIFEQLQGVVAARFDIIILKKQLQYDGVRRRLEKLNKHLEKQATELQNLKNEKDAKVEQRMNELIDPKERLNWK